MNENHRTVLLQSQRWGLCNRKIIRVLRRRRNPVGRKSATDDCTSKEQRAVSLVAGAAAVAQVGN